jgi:energy-coupling factor transporter ATP-binding protein EcfA2
MIERLTLKNFTVFTDLTLEMSPRINVIIGENGTGKTHLLKAAYGLCGGAPLFKNKPEISSEELEAALTTRLLRVFMPLDDKLGKLHRQGATDQACLSAHFVGGHKIAATFFNNSKALAVQDRTQYDQYQAEAVFIPTKEVLSLMKGITNANRDQKTIDLIFDKVYVDLANALMMSGPESMETQVNSNPRLNAIIPRLVELTKGRYHWKNGEFCFQAGRYEEKPSPKRTRAKSAQMYQDSTVTEFVPKKGHLYSSIMTAEGFRKVGILHRLLTNGTVSPGSSGPLFWDEPESNMNPRLMKSLVQILIELTRNGQQVIIGTHDYVLLKWLDLLADDEQGDHIRYHCLHRDDNTGEIWPETADDYSVVSRSAISNTFAELYDEDVKRALGG